MVDIVHIFKLLDEKKELTMLPRHAAGSFELKEGTGPITSMQSCGEFLEIYKINKTFRVRSPECIDPDDTNPNAPWVTSPVDDIGSGSPIVARVLLILPSNNGHRAKLQVLPQTLPG